MTIVAGLSASRHGGAPLHLAAQLARTTGEKILAATVLESNSALTADQLEREFRGHLEARTMLSLEQLVAEMRGELDITPVIHHSTSVARGLTELAIEHGADLLVVGSSSASLLGRIALGSVTERLVHTASVAVGIAPRGFPRSPSPVQRLTVAYGGEAAAAKLIPAAAQLAEHWHVPMRIASFTVRPTLMYAGSIETSAEDLVTRQWVRKTTDGVQRQLDEARASITIPDVDLVIGAGTDWLAAVEAVTWQSGDLLILGSGAAGQRAQVFLGSAASKILRHVPVPIMILPSQP